MKKKCLLLLLILIPPIMLSSVTVASFPPWTPLPRLDKQLFQVIKNETARVEALLVNRTVDMIPGPETTPNINSVLDAGFNISMTPSARYGFLALQCRDVWPPEAAGGTEGKVPGETCSPMNYSVFRKALTWIYAMDDKNASILSYFQGPQIYGIQSIIPPAQAYWYDPTATLPSTTEYYEAWIWMEAEGFYVDGAILYDPNDVPCRNLTLYYPNGSESWSSMLPSFVDAFNDFMDNYLGVTNCNLELKTRDFATLVYGNLMQYHDFDMIAMDLAGLGPDCDWLVNMFHSAYDIIWGWNFVGVHDSYMDYLLDIILHSTDTNEIRQACSDFQHYFNGGWPDSAIEFGAKGTGQMPQFLYYSGMAISSYELDVMNFIDMPCWGAEQCAEQWAFVEYKSGYTPPVPGAIRRALADGPTSINPFYEPSPYGWLLLDGLEERLLTRNPLTLEFQPWLTKDYYFEEPINTTTPSGKTILNGMRIDYYIREGIYWQDSGAYEDLNDNDVWDVGEPKYEFPFTAYDCQFAANVFMKYKPGLYGTVWTDLVETATDGPYKFTVWYNTTSYWYQTYPSVFSMFPQHIYQKADKMVDDGLMAKFSDFKPYNTHYEDWTGCHAPDAWGAPPAATGWWSALVGTGPFIFGYYDPVTGLGETDKNMRYWAGQSPILQSLETCAENYGLNFFKKELVGDVITLENTTVVDRASPVCSYLHETAPALSNKWHIDGWRDLNYDGLVSVGDEVTLSKEVVPTGDVWVGQGEYRVMSLIWDDVAKKWTLGVREVSYIAELTTTAVVVDFRSMVWKRGGGVQNWPLKINVLYNVFCDGVPIPTFAVKRILGPFEKRYECFYFIDWNIPPLTVGKHTFRVDFYVRQAESAQDPEYVCSVERVFVYLPGDASCDCIVNMLDIYTHGIKNFLYVAGSYAWDHWHNEAGDGPGTIPPAKTADVNNDGIVNMIDIYRMIIMFMKSVDP